MQPPATVALDTPVVEMQAAPFQSELPEFQTKLIVVPHTVKNTVRGIGTKLLQHTEFISVRPNEIVVVPPHESVLVDVLVG